MPSCLGFRDLGLQPYEPVLEAMRLGRPVVASAVDGIPEDVSDGIDGILVAPGDARALADALRSLVADPVRRVALGAAARSTFVARSSAERFAADLDAAYRRLGDERRLT